MPLRNHILHLIESYWLGGPQRMQPTVVVTEGKAMCSPEGQDQGATAYLNLAVLACAVCRCDHCNAIFIPLYFC